MSGPSESAPSESAPSESGPAASPPTASPYAERVDSTIEEYTPIVDASGKALSPILPEGKKNYLIDIDGTVGEDIPNEEPERMATAEAYPDAVETINRWYSEGHHICFFTARTEDHREVTARWLEEKGFRYHSLLMGKPRGGNYHWIDNHVVRATRYTSRFTDLVKRQVEIEVFDDE